MTKNLPTKCLNCNKLIRIGFYCSEDCIRTFRIREIKDIQKKIKTTIKAIYQKTSGTNITPMQISYIYQDLAKVYSQLNNIMDRIPQGERK
jgi:hypothetical protein